MNKYSIAIVGAGIYGSTIGLELARNGYEVTIFDPLGVMRAASTINQFRVHSGYHYPRSPETILEILEARTGFMREYRRAIVNDVETFYAIPHEGTRTKPDDYEEVLSKFNLPLQKVRPRWIDFNYIDKCYLVNEHIYDPNILRSLIIEKMKASKVNFVKSSFSDEQQLDYDFVVYATYGTSASHMHLFEKIKLQVVEKIQIKLPEKLYKKSLVVVDGPFTGFDPYGNTEYSQFGSALYTNHWETSDPHRSAPSKFSTVLNLSGFRKVNFSNFHNMLDEATKAVPLCAKAEYIGSRFTLRLVEDEPASDRRVLRIGQPNNKVFHVFSGKVVSAVKAAKIVAGKIGHA